MRTSHLYGRPSPAARVVMSPPGDWPEMHLSQQARARWSTWSRAEFIGVTIQALYASAGQAS